MNTGKIFEGYFEDMEPDLELTSPSRTITEGDLANYIAISGDYSQMYTNDDFANDSLLKGRVLPSLMVFAIATGLYGMIKGAQNHFLAMLGQRWQFHSFARAGDTLTVKVTFPRKRETRHSDRGIVTRSIKVVDTAGEVISSTEGDMMIGRRPAGQLDTEEQ